MTTPVSLPPVTPRRQRGIALVIVLAMLVLLSALVVAFFGNVSNELVASKSFSSGITTRQLSETTTNFVMAQLSDATSGFVDAQDVKSPILAWASQPGMIRTYRDTGMPHRYYKLYSAKTMVISEPSAGYNVNDEFSADLPQNWFQQPGAFTDLNAPLKRADGVFEYPIVDPTVQRSSSTGPMDGVDGFEIMGGPGYSGDETRVDPATMKPQANPAMMPARWIYVLRDGTLTPAPDQTGDILSWSGKSDPAGRPTAENPIVGRIAFWTDDETAKVNINTATEGTFWDRPWTAKETNFANFIPAQGEYQRYAGHPAMTCLSPVLGSVIPVSPTKSEYYWLAPRTMDGGTKAGTDSTYAQKEAGMGTDNERLFASVDELVFGPMVGGGALGTLFRTYPTGKVLSSGKASAFAELVRRSKFFLTVSNRAPDVNLFNRPRIGLWPLQYEANPEKKTGKERNAKDQLIAFCGATAYGEKNEAQYYFQRFSSYSRDKDRYGDGRLTFKSSVSSVGETAIPSSCHPTLDWSNVPRNQQVYAYLQDLTGRDVPGFGGSLKGKWDADLPKGGTVSERDQILTEAMDYIRSEVNTYGTSDTLKPHYDYAPTRNAGPVAGETQIIPLRVTKNNTQGFGRYATVTEVALVFHHVKVQAKDYLRAYVILEPFNPTPGPASWSPHLRYVIKGLEKFQVGGSAIGPAPQDLGFPKPVGAIYPSNWTTARVGFVGGGHKLALMGATTLFRYFEKNPDPPKIFGTTNAEKEYPFATPLGVELANANPGARFGITNDVELELELYSGYEPLAANKRPNPNLLVQRLHMTFPKVDNLPLPVARNDFNARIKAGTYMMSDDVIRSVEVSDNAAGGDLRYMCALPDVPAAFFVPNRRYASTQPAAHSLRSHGLTSVGYDNASDPILVTGASYNQPPVAAAYVREARHVSGPGDFDNAPSDWPDGAYINKADEGNIETGANSWLNTGSFKVEDGRTFSPNRQISSAVTFGSLPTGIKTTELYLRSTSAKDEPLPQGRKGANRPWQTLLFTAQPSSGPTRHPGFGTPAAGVSNQPPYVEPPDHLFLDLFTMPIVEPYAMSEPFSTQGRVNLNYQLAPYTYIKRTTGLHAVLKSTQMMAIPTTSGDKSAARRYAIDPSVGGDLDGAKLDQTKGTLYGFQKKFEAGDIFRSASQICDISLIPENVPGKKVDYSSIDSFWTEYQRTGDNVREGPYGHIYPRITTKSNTFTVHMRVQALRKSTGQAPDEWKESAGQVAGEYRGSATIERYLEASSPALPDFADPSTKDNLDRHYRFRILNTKAFVR